MERRAVHGVDDDGNAQRPAGRAAEDPALRAVRVHHVRRKCPQRALDRPVRAEVAHRMNRPAQRRHDVDRDVAAAKRQQVAFGAQRGARDQQRFVAEEPNEVPAAQQRVLLSPADDHSCDDVSNTHGVNRSASVVRRAVRPRPHA